MKATLLLVLFPLWAFLPFLAIAPKGTSGELAIFLGLVSVVVAFLPIATSWEAPTVGKVLLFIPFLCIYAVLLFVLGWGVVGMFHATGA